MSDQNDFFIDGAQIDDLHAQGIFDQTSADIPEVGCPLTQIGIVQLGHHGGILFNRVVDRFFCTEMLIADQRDDVTFQLFVFEQHDVPFEDGLFFFTECAASHLFDGFELL